MTSQTFNLDCMIGMAQYPDKYFDLAVVDPPYGIGMDGGNVGYKGANNFDKKDWDNAIPSKEYFDELFRVSTNQIIWGGNYFTDFLRPTKAWIFWYKGQNDLTMSDGEMAWTSFNKVTKQIEINRGELAKQNTFHPTEKPIKLYRWIFHNYAKPNDKILDTHLGSGSSRIAAHKAGLDFTGYELDKDYFEAQEKRYKQFISQQVIEFPTCQ